MRSSTELTPKERFLAACRAQPVDRPPGWMMRQAGRYMPEYQAVRGGIGFLDLCKRPELARDVTMQPIDALGLETAIVFSDILLPAEAMGMSLSFGDGGPSLGSPLRTRADVEALIDFDPAATTPWPATTIELTKPLLGPDRALIGFCGAPFTMASYMVEGRGSRVFENVKRMMFADPETLHLLLDRVTDNLIPYLAAQVRAGADAVQIFDSWAGCLGVEHYERFARPATARLVAGVRDLGVPIILYVNGCQHLLESMAATGADVLGIDWRVEAADAMARVGDRVALQGNLDPAALLATPAIAAEATRRTIAAFASQNGYVFNLGSGVLRWTPVPCARAVADVLRTG